ncbi:MAG: hypothetical protein LBJ73_03715 [Rickettsiales bacterium]|nr:hypothetical protein [Rickettsiales bacterium]
MKRFERKQNFVKKEQKIYGREQRRLEKEKNKVQVFTLSEYEDIKKCRQEMKARRRFRVIEIKKDVFTAGELTEIQRLLHEFHK